MQRNWFYIPIDVAKPIIRHFVEEVCNPYIGIVGFDREMASYYNRNRYIEEGIYVVELIRMVRPTVQVR